MVLRINFFVKNWTKAKLFSMFVFVSTNYAFSYIEDAECDRKELCEPHIGPKFV